MSRHQKRISAPKSWPIARKTNKWIINTNPGPHKKEQSLPLAVIVRDILNLASTMRETKKILNAGNVLVDGIPRKDPNFPVGLFDVIAIPKNNQYYRVLLNDKGILELRTLDNPDAKKLCKIVNKTTVKGGKTQLNLHDGTNLLATNEYQPGDSIVLSIPDKTITKHLRFAEGNIAIIIGGQHSGETGNIISKRTVKGSAPNTVTINTSKGDIGTLEEYVYVIGEDKLEIKVGVHNE